MENLPATNAASFIKCDVNNYNDIASDLHGFRFDYVTLSPAATVVG